MTEEGRITRGRVGRIDQLDEGLRETIHKMLRGGKTQARIVEVVSTALAERGEPPISAASLNRYINRPAIRALAERTRIACEIGEAIARTAEEGAGAKLDRGLIQAGQTLAMEALAEVDWQGLEDEDRVKLVANFALAVRRFNASQVVVDARERAIRADERAAANERANKVMHRRGLSADATAAIRAAIEGAPE